MNPIFTTVLIQFLILGAMLLKSKARPSEIDFSDGLSVIAPITQPFVS
ncbi:hypothetical protein [Neisseria animaloris]|nr:hypothetical protein [Neisseria animaloris]